MRAGCTTRRPRGPPAGEGLLCVCRSCLALLAPRDPYSNRWRLCRAVLAAFVTRKRKRHIAEPPAHQERRCSRSRSRGPGGGGAAAAAVAPGGERAKAKAAGGAEMLGNAGVTSNVTNNCSRPPLHSWMRRADGERAPLGPHFRVACRDERALGDSFFLNGLLTEGLPPAAQAAAPIAKKVRRAGGTGVGSRALVARVGVPSGPLEGCRVGEARNPGPTETDGLNEQRTYAADALARAGFAAPAAANHTGWRTPSLWETPHVRSSEAATPPDLTPATPIGRSRCNVDGLAAGAGQRFPATWSVRSSEAATLLEETPRLDRDEALVQGEAAPGQPRLPPCSWWTRGPPVAAVSAAGNSWLYVLLLHAAAGTLERSAFEAWARQTTWGGWLPMVQLLQEAAPADVGIIRLVLEGQGANQAAARLPDTSRYAVSLPLPAVAAFLVELDGYFIASVQETLLEIFAGPEAATQLPGCANTFRLAPVPTPGHSAGTRARRWQLAC